MPARKDKYGLTKLQRAFADAYLLLPRESRSAAAAYKKVKPKVSQRSAEVQGSVQLNAPEVAAYISAREKDVIAEIREKQIISEEEVIQELAHMGLARLTDVLVWDEQGNVRYRSSDELDARGRAAVKGIKMTITEQENRQGEVRTTKRMELLMHDKIKPLELLGKYRELGLFTEKVEIGGNGGGLVVLPAPTNQDEWLKLVQAQRDAK